MRLQAHHSCVYQALFFPHQPDILATCSADGILKIFDFRAPSNGKASHITNTSTNPQAAPVLNVPGSWTEVLSIDMNKYRHMVLTSAGVDKLAKIWDCRMIKTGGVGRVGRICRSRLLGHEYAIRKVQWNHIDPMFCLQPL